MNRTDSHDDQADPYTPRPRAAQTVAVQKRAQAQDDEPPTPNRPHLIAGIGAAAFVVLMLAMITWQLGHAPTALKLEPTAAQAFGKQAQEATPAPTSAPTAAPRTIAAYAAPNEAPRWQIEADRSITPAAHYGSAWVAYQDGAGLVWVRASDRPDLALAGPDLAPAQPAPQTGRGLTVNNDWTPPEATPVPTPVVLSQQQIDASAASTEQNELDNALNGLSAAEQAALVATAEANVRRMVTPTVTR